MARDSPSTISQTGIAVAYLELDPLSQHYRVRFRYAGKQYKRSLRTSDSREARGLKGRVEETILLLERGRLEMPNDADPATFILSDGKLAKKQTTSVVNTVGDEWHSVKFNCFSSNAFGRLCGVLGEVCAASIGA
jgi:hypothetical protein